MSMQAAQRTLHSQLIVVLKVNNFSCASAEVPTLLPEPSPTAGQKRGMLTLTVAAHPKTLNVPKTLNCP